MSEDRITVSHKGKIEMELKANHRQRVIVYWVTAPLLISVNRSFRNQLLTDNIQHECTGKSCTKGDKMRLW